MSTEPLSQQELIVPAPRRKVLVAEGMTAHWGVDPSSKRVAIATVSAGGLRGVTELPFPEMSWAARLPVIYEETRRLARDLAQVVPPGLVWLEQPSGTHVEHELEFAVGMIAAGLYEGVRAACEVPARIELITSSSWKKLACGKGNLYKPTKKKLGRTPMWGDYGVAMWASLNGYHGRSWDEADAWAIAEAARRDVTLEVR